MTTNQKETGFEITITGHVKGTLKIFYENDTSSSTITTESKGKHYAEKGKKDKDSNSNNNRPERLALIQTTTHACDASCALNANFKEVAIEFEDPDHLLQKEKKSKRLFVESDLVKYLSCIRWRILQKFPQTKGNDRPWHIELSSRFISEEVQVRKAQSMQGRKINVQDPGNYKFMGVNDRAFVLKTGEVEDYGATHTTIGFFAQPLTEDEKKWVLGQVNI